MLASAAVRLDKAEVVIPAAVNASLFGANTVNGPAPLRVVARPAFVTAALRVLNSVVVVTRFAMFGVTSSSFLQLRDVKTEILMSSV